MRTEKLRPDSLRLGAAKLPAVAVAGLVLIAASPAPTVAITGRVLGASGAHPVYVALWDAAGFQSKPVQQIRLGADGSFRFEVAPGRWAVSAFEDVNENGVLDMGLFGPKEPAAFWRPYHAYRKPRFEDVAMQVDGTLSDANISLR